MARSRTKLRARVTPWAQFHAYVLGSVIGIRWGRIAPTSGMGNDGLCNIVKEYLNYVAGDDQLKQINILNAMRDKSSTAIKQDARSAFPSLFPRHRKARPLAIPKELEEENVNFNSSLIDNWKERAKEIKRELTMNENATAERQETTEQTGSSTSEKTRTSRVTVNFFIPTGVNPDTITLENYREMTGKRFRMTKEQKTRGLDRGTAFEESKTLAVSQLGG